MPWVDASLAERGGDKMKQAAHLDQVLGNGIPRAIAKVHVAFQVDVQELKDEIELCVGVYDVEQSVRAPSASAWETASGRRPGKTREDHLREGRRT